MIASLQRPFRNYLGSSRRENNQPNIKTEMLNGGLDIINILLVPRSSRISEHCEDVSETSTGELRASSKQPSGLLARNRPYLGSPLLGLP